MFKEATLYAPVISDNEGVVEVLLAEDHPGFDDEQYRAHRNRIAELALHYREGEPVPCVAYTENEHELWTRVAFELEQKHEKYACEEFRHGAEQLSLARCGVPQLGDVSQRLEKVTGFRLAPAPGLVPLRQFYGSLERNVFWATQYVRYHTYPNFSPEPDIIHELIGHANTLASKRFAHVYNLVGAAINRLETDAAVQLVSRVFWFMLEYGVAWERGELCAFGASLLSSFGELEQFRSVPTRDVDVKAMGEQDYDVANYQPVLFASRSLAHAEDFLGSFMTTVDDDTVARLGIAAKAG